MLELDVQVFDGLSSLRSRRLVEKAKGFILKLVLFPVYFAIAV